MEKFNNIYCIVLAAGESTRMGQPKALLKFNNVSFLEHLINVTKTAGLINVIIVLGYDSEKIRNSLRLENFKNNLNIKIVVNKDYKLGQLSSIHTALRALPENAEAIILLPVDRPLISRYVLEEILEKYFLSNAKIVIPTFEGKRGHPVLFSSAMFNELMDAPLDIGARYVVWNHPEELVEVETSESGILINIDTPEDYKKYILKD